MSFIAKPRLWLCTAAALAALWVSFRVLDADAAVLPALLPTEEVVVNGEIPDPALDALIHRLAVEAGASSPRSRR